MTCYNHSDRAAVVTLDWPEDGAEFCTDCILPTVRSLATGFAIDFPGVDRTRDIRIILLTEDVDDAAGPWAEHACSRCGGQVMNAVPLEDGASVCDPCVDVEYRAGEASWYHPTTGPRNPHLPADGADTILCAGCGHRLDPGDDCASTDAYGGDLVIWHVACPLPAGLTILEDGQPMLIPTDCPRCDQIADSILPGADGLPVCDECRVGTNVPGGL